jgi:DNA-binding transcriptional LysR family regulator
MGIKFLRTLIAISEKGNFSDAADQVCVTPAAVSQQMKRLEEMLEVELFDRNRRTPELTLTGKVLVPRAREVVRAYDSMLKDVENEYPMSGEFTIGTVSSSLATLLPVSIKTLLSNYPEIHIRLLTAPSHDLLPQLDRGAIDAAIMSKPLQLRSHFKWQTFAEEDMVVMCSKELQSNDPFELLKNNPYIRMSRHTVVGVMSDDILQDANVNIQDTMELESLESITNMVSHNLGVAIVPRPGVMDVRHEGLKLISIGSATQSRVMGILSREDNLKFRMVDGLLDSLKNTIDESK